jgi:hypothetical protein
LSKNWRLRAGPWTATYYGKKSNERFEQSERQQPNAIAGKQDNRVTAGAGAATLVMSRANVGGDVNVTSTDFGSVSKAFDFASGIAKGAADEATASGAQVQQMATSAMQSVQAAYKDTSGTVAAAYETAKAGEQKIMVMAALAVVGIVAVKVMGKSA